MITMTLKDFQETLVTAFKTSLPNASWKIISSGSRLVKEEDGFNSRPVINVEFSLIEGSLSSSDRSEPEIHAKAT